MAMHRANKSSYAALVGDATVRAALHTEQHGHCAYCERPIRPATHVDHQTRIDHFHPQKGKATHAKACKRASGTNQLHSASTAWSNMVLCCNGQLEGKLECCDRSKDNTDICDDFRNPKTYEAERLVEIHSDGAAVACGYMPAQAQQVIDHVLRLNERELKAARHERLRAVKAEIHGFRSTQGYAPTRAAKSKFAERLRQRVSNGDVAYGSVNLTLAARLDP